MLYRHVAREVAAVEGGFFGLDVDKGYPHGDVFSRWVYLAYNNNNLSLRDKTKVHSCIKQYKRT